MKALFGVSCLFVGLTGVVLASATSTHDENLRCSVLGRNHPDYVPYLPGYNQPLPSNWYSGYLSYEFQNRTIHTHYTFVEAEDNIDGTKPTIYWSNGGPGASSLFGLLTELGPLLLNERSLLTDDYRATKIPTPLYNPYTWTRLGNILVFDQPAPIGFSYCNNSTDSHSCDGIVWTDELTAKNALAAMIAFRNKFSCLAVDLYLIGESYAGIYIPTLAREIINYNANSSQPIALKGFAVGDGCLGTETGICINLSPNNTDGFDPWYLLFLAGHGQIPFETYHEVLKSCTDQKSPGTTIQELSSHIRKDNQHKFDTVLSTECNDALQKVKHQVGGVYEYGLYDECTYTNGLLMKYLEGKVEQGVGAALNDYPCGGDIVMEQMYLTLQPVQEALNVKSKWFSVDNAGLDFDYTPTERDLTGFYRDMVRNDSLDIKVLIYNGDTDPAITSFASQNWTSSLGFLVLEDWRPWTLDGCRRVGGYVKRYAGNFDFLTVRGAGHMVPTNKAAASFTFIQAWISGDNYPAYVKDCVAPGVGNWSSKRIKGDFVLKANS